MRHSHYLVAIGGWLFGAMAIAQPAPDGDQLAAFQIAVERLNEQLDTVVANGILSRRTETAGLVEVKAHDLQVITDWPRFRVQLMERPALAVNEQNTRQRGEQDALRSDNRANPQTQVVIFDGESVYSIRFSDDGITAKAQFAFQQQSALRTAGYPFHPPLMLWQAYPLPAAPLSELTIQPLSGEGLVVHQRALGYTAKYYFFGEFEYDLRRIAFFTPKQSRPFREVSCEWSEEAGVRFVSRFSIRERHVSDDPADTRHALKDLAIDFHSISVNPNDVSQTAFDLADLALPIGTRFEDQRVNKMGKPAVLVWDGEKLIDDSE